VAERCGELVVGPNEVTLAPNPQRSGEQRGLPPACGTRWHVGYQAGLCALTDRSMGESGSAPSRCSATNTGRVNRSGILGSERHAHAGPVATASLDSTRRAPGRARTTAIVRAVVGQRIEKVA
jgi:hypothetical protein